MPKVHVCVVTSAYPTQGLPVADRKAELHCQAAVNATGRRSSVNDRAKALGRENWIWPSSGVIWVEPNVDDERWTEFK